VHNAGVIHAFNIDCIVPLSVAAVVAGRASNTVDTDFVEPGKADTGPGEPGMVVDTGPGEPGSLVPDIHKADIHMLADPATPMKTRGQKELTVLRSIFSFSQPYQGRGS
jgi:hypothetical protein